jgi:hypothetical protein
MPRSQRSLAGPHPLNSATLPLLLACALLATGCGSRNPAASHKPVIAFRTTAAPRLPVRIAQDLVVKRAQFGILETTPDGDERFVPTSQLPPEEGQVFGWTIEVETTRDALHWQEHLQLPHAPADWGDAATDPDLLISKDGRSVVAQGDDLVEDGELSRFYWALAPGDPMGSYEMDVAVEGKTVAHFAFRVPAPVQEKAILVRHEAPRRALRLATSARLTRATGPRAAGEQVWR